MKAFRSFSVIGGGAWGTALAATLRREDVSVSIWAREADVVEAVNGQHENSIYLPGVALAPEIHATGDLRSAVEGADAAVLVVPAQYMRDVTKLLAPFLKAGTPVIIATKGIEIQSGATMGEVVASTLPGHPQAVLSGPTFAIEVARGLPTAVTLATADTELGNALVEALGTNSFRPYLSDDLVGCEIGGSVKNVMAIACGIVSGRGLGDNARAALMTRGVAEMVRLAVAKGGKPATLMGLSGLGDLTLTCTAMQSRNCSLGAALGRGETLAAALGARRSVAEGVATAKAVTSLAASLNVSMPIVAAVDAILHHEASIDDEIRRLLARPFKSEV